jgi:hypothetical protein
MNGNYPTAPLESSVMLSCIWFYIITHCLLSEKQHLWLKPLNGSFRVHLILVTGWLVRCEFRWMSCDAFGGIILYMSKTKPSRSSPNTTAAPSRVSWPGAGMGPRPQGPPAGGEDGPIHHLDRVPTHPGHLFETVPEEGPQHHQRPKDEVWYQLAQRQFLFTSHQTAEHLNWTDHLHWFSTP